MQYRKSICTCAIDEPALWGDELHKPIIDEKTFYIVQDILEGIKKNLPDKFQTVRDKFPLRDYLACSQCNITLTASASKERAGGKFFYYHCSNGCKERKKACIVNDGNPFQTKYERNP